MCNAWNHDPDCFCGFGPPYVGVDLPYPGTVTVGDAEEWMYTAARGDEGQFTRAFRDLGLSDAAIKEDRGRYRADVMPTIDAGGSPEQIRPRLLDILKRREYRVEESDTTAVKVPLFKLHSPHPTGSRVTYEETTADEERGSWSVKIFGTGMGATRTLTVQYRNEFSSKNGGYAVIFVPVQLRVQKVAVYERGQLSSHGLRTEVDRSTVQGDFAKGVRILSREELRRDIESARPDGWFPLAEAPPSPASTYARRWASESGVEVRLGVTMFDLDASIKVGLHRQATLGLTYELPGGHDYLVLRLSQGPGIVWNVE